MEFEDKGGEYLSWQRKCSVVCTDSRYLVVDIYAYINQKTVFGIFTKKTIFTYENYSSYEQYLFYC